VTVNWSSLVPVESAIANQDLWDSNLDAMFDEASQYMKSFQWVLRITESYFGLGVPGVVAVFLFRIEPATPDLDEWLWVIVGDLPPAYLVTDSAPNPAMALDAYVGEMEKWVQAAMAGQSVDDLIPVNVEPTYSNAEALRRRLRMIDDDVLSQYSDDLNS
jgi:hypothetical protein